MILDKEIRVGSLVKTENDSQNIAVILSKDEEGKMKIQWIDHKNPSLFTWTEHELVLAEPEDLI